MNSITLVGRAGRDPEVRYFESGTCVANLTLAVRGLKKDDDTEWFNLEIWGKTAQVAADYVRKGSLIGVVGRIRTERWTDKTTGQERSKPVVAVNNLELLSSKSDTAAAPPAAAPAAAPSSWEQEVPF